MDRLGLLRSAWTAPLVLGLIGLGLWWGVRETPPEAARRWPPVFSQASLTPASAGRAIPSLFRWPSEPDREFALWLPALGNQSRAVLTSFTLARPVSGEADLEGPSLTPLPSAASSAAPGPESSAPKTRLNVIVPEPELLPDGAAGTGEPIPPRLSQRPGPPVPAAEVPPPPPTFKAATSEPWQPQAVTPPVSQPPATAAPTARPAPGLLAAPGVDPAQRSQGVELIAREADVHTRRGFELAGRGACLSARAEFIAALRMIAQTLDTEQQTNLHSQALATGLTALREADDFAPNGPKLEAELDLAGMIRRHRTPVLKGVEAPTLTPMVALQSYLTFAQEQLGLAVGREVAGSMALRGLGKLHEALADKKLQNVQAARPKAMVFYQASLLCCPENFMASNDLGVLLARNGRYEDARVALEHSLSLVQQPAGWHNLAVVYQQLGYADGARQAQQRAEVLQRAEAGKQAGRSAANQMVQWLDPRTFAQTTPEQPSTPMPTLPLQPQATATADAPPGEPNRPHVAKSSSPNRTDRRK